MALPQQIAPATPPGGDLVSQGDDQIRALKQAIVDIFGIPAATNINNSGTTFGPSGLLKLTLQDAVASGLAGDLTRFGLRLFNGDSLNAKAIPQEWGFNRTASVVGAEVTLTSAIFKGASLFTGGSLKITICARAINVGTGTPQTLPRILLGGTDITSTSNGPTTGVSGTAFWQMEWLVLDPSTLMQGGYAIFPDPVTLVAGVRVMNAGPIALGTSLSIDQTLDVRIKQNGTGASCDAWVRVEII